MNNKGFVLMETLVVTIFALFIFTVLYNSIVPLLGKYNELSYYNDIDTTYDLYHLKKLFKDDSNITSITTYEKLTCDKLSSQVSINKCFLTYNFLELNTNDEIIFFNKNYLNSSELLNNNDISSDIKSYLKYVNSDKNILVFKKNDYISYLEF